MVRSEPTKKTMRAAEDDPVKTLDVVTIGRASVDLYGQQIGARLEEVETFTRAVGGCPANIAIGTARLGLKSALITRVGREQMGRFILERLAREGVETAGIRVDPDRLTALVLLGVEDEGVSPMIFVRTDCADMAVDETDIPEDLIASTRAVVVTGTHFSRPHAASAQLKAIRLAKAHGAKVVFDIDYRPNLWGLAGHEAGFERYVRSDAVTAHLAAILPDCDLIVGTEEEIRIASGADDVLTALTAIRAVSGATIVLKRGADGCVVYDGPITGLEHGIVGRGFPIEVYNVLGAGDAFMSGFLSGWLNGTPLTEAATRANACGAFAVSRLLCSPEYPTRAELAHFLAHGSAHRALRKDADLNHIHWATTRPPGPDGLMALAIDHRKQLEDLADAAGAPWERIADFKLLAVEAAARVAAGRPGFGMLIDGTHGRRALFKAVKHPFWIGRPVEKPGSRPLAFDGYEDVGGHLIDWPARHTVKCLCFYHPEDAADLKAEQDRALIRVAEAARAVGRELMIEIIASKHGPLGPDTLPRVMNRLYDLGVKPDWWKLESQTDEAAWGAIDAVITLRDPYCRGVVLLGLDAPLDELTTAFRLAASARCVKGFAVGRTIFGAAARGYLEGSLSDEAAIADMATRFATLVEAWTAIRPIQHGTKGERP